MFIKLLTTCTSSLNFVKMVTFIAFCRKSVKSMRKKPKIISNKSWKESNICIQMASFTGISNQLIFLWKMANVKLAILVLLKTLKTKTLSWNPLLELHFTCLHSCLKRQNIPTSLIFGQLDLFIIKCSMEEHHGQLQMSFNFWMEFIQKSHHSIHLSVQSPKTSFWNVLKFKRIKEWVGKMLSITLYFVKKSKDRQVHVIHRNQP